eukprot:6795042-Alexandrium_andersonii.AAC.1
MPRRKCGARSCFTGTVCFAPVRLAETPCAPTCSTARQLKTPANNTAATDCHTVSAMTSRAFGLRSCRCCACVA